MKTIALEEHFLTRDYVKVTGAYGGLGGNGPEAALQPKLLEVGAGRLADMDAAGIDVQVMSAAAQGFDALDIATGISLATDSNDQLASAIAAHPDRFGGLALLPMKDPEAAARELERAVTKLKLHGALISGTIDGLFLDDQRFGAVLGLAQQLDVPVYVHPAPPPKPVFEAYYGGLPIDLAHQLSINGWGWHTETGLHVLRMICTGVFDRFPRLQVIIGHMGEGIPYAMARSNRVLRPVMKAERSIEAYFQTNIWVTSSGYFSLPPLQCALDVIGIDRLMFSVDFPFSANKLGRELLDEAPKLLNPTQFDAFTHGNAERILRRNEGN